MGRVTELGRGRDLVSSRKEGAAVGMKNGDGTRTWGKGAVRNISWAYLQKETRKRFSSLDRGKVLASTCTLEKGYRPCNSKYDYDGA